MKTRVGKSLCWLSVAIIFTVNAGGATHYVDLNSTNATSPYTDWTTAATNIQDAVDASSDGDQVLVTNGVYNMGGRAVNGFALTNRIAITKAVLVQSVNGANATVIEGYQVSGTTNGSSAVRCAYLANGATLAGFTLTNGATLASGDVTHECGGGGVWCESGSAVIFDCSLVGNAAFMSGGGAYNGWVLDSVLNNNSAYTGGGAYQGTLINCVLNSNSAPFGGGTAYAELNGCTLRANVAVNAGLSAPGYGGGAYGGTLNNCVVVSNTGSFKGGGVYGAILNNCILTGNYGYFGGGAISSTLTGCVLTNNSADQGGGAWYGTLNNCVLVNNYAREYGGAAFVATLNNCLINGNSASFGGGADQSTLNNCTLAGNVAANFDGDGSLDIVRGGGAYSSTLNNCIIYFNTISSIRDTISAPNHYVCTLNYCCTTIDDGGGSVITNDPRFVNLAGGIFIFKATHRVSIPEIMRMSMHPLISMAIRE